MPLKRFSCRTHGGIFSMPARRGRPPVRCTEEHQCDKAEAEVTNIVREVPGVGKVAVVTSKAPERVYAAATGDNPSLSLAMTAKASLLDLGWTVTGKAGGHPEGQQWATVRASRGAETLIINWSDGALVDQLYSVDFGSPEGNGLPGRDLKFDPDELTDRELVQRIAGEKVTWWNTLASARETGIIGDRVSIEHIFDQGEHADNSKRLVKFIDRNGHGFRAFHVSALMKVG